MTLTVAFSDPPDIFEPLLNIINNHLWKAKRCLLVTGAGISCSGGIPDFRSSDGLYNLVKSKYPKSVVKGRDLFDASLFQDPTSTAVFYTFMAELKTLVSRAHHTRTHSFLRRLHDQGRLLRCYTQNIDCLEQHVDLTADLDPATTPRPGPPVVQLHGTINRVKCTLCSANFDFTSQHADLFREGYPPSCPQCEDNERERERLGKRATATGTLRPDIVLYNEHHPYGERIGELQAMDLRRRPDVMIVMGTSLKIVGLKRFVKEAAKVVHAQRNGKVVFVNRTEPGKEWEDVIDYHVLGDTDRWVELVEEWMDEEERKKEDKENAGVREERGEVEDDAKVLVKQTTSKGVTAAEGLKKKKDGSILEVFKVTKQISQRGERKEAGKKLSRPSSPFKEVRDIVRDDQNLFGPSKSTIRASSSSTSLKKPKPFGTTIAPSPPKKIYVSATASSSASPQRRITSFLKPGLSPVSRPPLTPTSTSSNHASPRSSPSKGHRNDENHRPDGPSPPSYLSPSKRTANTAPTTSSSPPKKISLEIEREDIFRESPPKMGFLGLGKKAVEREPAPAVASEGVTTRRATLAKRGDSASAVANESQLTKAFKVAKQTASQGTGVKKGTGVPAVGKRAGLRSAGRDENTTAS
ncbi:DHS-like NAD/FAD-binding domain-containing protein [Jimgerdemannia flammicorona]|uniref:DHS-like NAD/FAD-binding domain-containing protein n=1 Tax=Jimgerdemannia flammicorona TaxID=994334 RepID=A0A433D5K6_9FUNG|nr:DHS-like NAD/FAD-binding domain-containing protein [Jimgerdemannia flammicorona]